MELGIGYIGGIHRHILAGNFYKVQEDINNGVDVNIQDGFKQRPLNYACRIGKLDIVKLLLNNGANIEACDHIGTTPVLDAIEHGRYDVVKLLLDLGCTTDQRALDLAQKYGYTKIIKLIESYEIPIKSALEE